MSGIHLPQETLNLSDTQVEELSQRFLLDTQAEELGRRFLSGAEAEELGQRFLISSDTQAEDVGQRFRISGESSESTIRIDNAETNAGTILIIDDLVPCLEMQALQLQTEGFIVTTAHGPSEGLRELTQHRFTLCLCDLNMPHKSGYGLIEEFREWEREQSRDDQQLVYALTGFIDENVRSAAADAGMQGVLSKPLDIAAVIEVIGGQCL